MQSTFSYGGSIKVYELPQTGTCDNNKNYRGWLWAQGEPYTNTVYVYLKNNGPWSLVHFTKSTYPDEYVFADADGAHWMVLGYYQNFNFRCGWGSWTAPLNLLPFEDPDLFDAAGHHGVNSGF